MSKLKRHKRRIVIVGAGNVGSTIAYTVLLRDIAPEIILIDRDQDKATGQVLDINHAIPYLKESRVRTGTFGDCKTADAIVLTAGSAPRPGQTQLELAKENLDSIRQITEDVMGYTDDPLFVVVSNPVDLMTYAVRSISGLPSARVIGTGTVADTAHLRFVISNLLDVNVQNVHAYMIGEHGDGEIAMWSQANVGGMPLNAFAGDWGIPPLPEDRIEAGVLESANDVMRFKGYTSFGIAVSAAHILNAIVNDTDTVATVSTVLDGQQGISGVALSLPAQLGAAGVKRYLPINLTGKERDALFRSAEKLRKMETDLGI